MNNTLPTKNNLIKMKNSIKLSKQGQELLDKKRFILMREKEKYEEQAQGLRDKLKESQEQASLYLRQTNVNIGIEEVNYISRGISLDDGLDIKYKTIMGVEIPSIVHQDGEKHMTYGIVDTPMSLDKAIEEFNNVKKLLIEIAGVEHTIKRLKVSISKTQKRSNALKDIIIPRDEKIVAEISGILEEREREEFSRLKVIKRNMK